MLVLVKFIVAAMEGRVGKPSFGQKGGTNKMGILENTGRNGPGPQEKTEASYWAMKMDAES